MSWTSKAGDLQLNQKHEDMVYYHSFDSPVDWDRIMSIYDEEVKMTECDHKFMELGKGKNVATSQNIVVNQCFICGGILIEMEE